MIAMHAADHFVTLARYHLWATGRLLDAVQMLSDADYRRDVGLFFGSVHGTLNHLLVAEHQIWWQRLTMGQSPQAQLNAIVHEDRGMVDVQLRSLSARWQSWIPTLDTERWAGDLHYTTMHGTAVRLPLAATVAHVFNHATHHRGQITAALTQLGVESPALDLIYYLQQAFVPAAQTTA